MRHGWKSVGNHCSTRMVLELNYTKVNMPLKQRNQTLFWHVFFTEYNFDICVMSEFKTVPLVLYILSLRTEGFFFSCTAKRAFKQRKGSDSLAFSFGFNTSETVRLGSKTPRFPINSEKRMLVKSFSYDKTWVCVHIYKNRNTRSHTHTRAMKIEKKNPLSIRVYTHTWAHIDR